MPSFLDVDGLKIRYSSTPASEEEDKHQDVVLFHGNAFSLDDWISNGTVNLLSQEGYSVSAIDLPAGRGSKSTKVEKKELQDYVPVLETIFEKLGIAKESRPAVIVGPSMGGGFALAYTIVHPTSVSALVLISPSIRNLDESQLSSIKLPVLLIWGEKDNVFHLEEYGRPLKEQLSRSKLLILKGAGHAAYLDKPEEFHEILLDFLGEIS